MAKFFVARHPRVIRLKGSPHNEAATMEIEVMPKFIPVTMRTNLIGQADNKVVYYAVDRIIKIEEDPHGGTILTLTPEDGRSGTVTVNSTDSIMEVLSLSEVSDS